MSSGTDQSGAKVRGELARELRQFHGLSASFYRAAAARAGLTITDLQVLDLLESAGPSTAGQLADLTGLTTGAITGMLNRLEEAGHLRRERDPSDGRRVIVRLAPGGTGGYAAGARLAELGTAWDDLALELDTAETVAILDFLKRCTTLARAEILRLRDGDAAERGVFSAPLGNLTSGRLTIDAGGSMLTVRADDKPGALFRARFEGPAPEVGVKDGEVSIRYPRRLVVSKPQRVADVALSLAVPWRIAIQAKAAVITAQLARLDLSELTVEGGASQMRVELPAATMVVPVRIKGAASEIVVRRPAGVAARVHLRGWSSMLVFDDQTSYGGTGGDARLQSSGFDVTGPYYDIEVQGATSMVTVTAG